MPRDLLRQPMIVQGRPVGDRRRLDQLHGYLELVDAGNPGHRRRQGIEAAAQGNDPIIPPQVVQRLDEIVVTQPCPRRQLSRSVRGENAVAFIGEEPDQLDAGHGPLRLSQSDHSISIPESIEHLLLDAYFI